jgi:peroxiredoxin
LPVTTSTGTTALVGQPPVGKRQVLFIFNTTCSYCEASLPAWEAIGARLRDTDAAAELYAVSLHDQETTAAYVALHRLSIPSVALPDRKFARLYRASVVPLTLVIDDEGQVRYARPGVIRRGVVMDSILEAAGIAPAPSPQREDRSAGARGTPSSS